MISLIVAASNNNAIGKDNQLLWHLPNDMKFFKSTTWAMPVIMGRKTFESMGSRLLPGRTNIIITRDSSWNFENALPANSIHNAIEIAKNMTAAHQIFIAGGGEIYAQSMDIADVIYMTRVATEIDGDTFFPTIDTSIWHLETKQQFSKDEKHQYDYSFEKWTRKK